MGASSGTGSSTYEPPNGRWPKWMAMAPSIVFSLMYGVSGVLGALTGLVDDWRRPALVIGFIVLFLAGVLLNLAHHSNEELRLQHDDQRAQLMKDNVRAIYERLIGYDLRYLLHVVAEAVAEEDSTARRRLASTARQSIIFAAAKLVGQETTTGTRANLFKLSGSAGSRAMALEPNGFAGRGDKSDRVFQEGVNDETFDATMNNKIRFVPSATAEFGVNHGLAYETFLTHPVSIGRERILGVLTVDCLENDQLEEAIDVPIMAVLSTLIAITYECEKYQTCRRVP